MGESTVTFGLIPARGGSKGVPRKNVRMVGGKPLIAWAIEAARDARELDAFAVSSDDDEIADIAQQWGAPVIRRPAEIAGDMTPMTAVVRHALAELDSEGNTITHLALLQPTTPMRTATDVDGALAVMKDAGVESVISVCRVEDHHPSRMYTLEDGALTSFYPDTENSLRQELVDVYHRNGAIYACLRASFDATGSLWGGTTAAYVMPRERSINVDNMLDLTIVRHLMGGGDAEAGDRRQ